MFSAQTRLMMSKKRNNRKNVEARPTTIERVKSDDRLLWRLVTDHTDIFDTHVVPKLNGNDVKFFYDVNSESRGAIKRSNLRLPNAFKIEDFDTKSTLSWALEKCSEEKERFCSRMARNGNIELLQHLHENGCPWDIGTCMNAAENGHLECLRYAHENGCPWDGWTCSWAALRGHLECLKYAHENECPWDKMTCSWASKNGQLECLKYAHENKCPWNKETCYMFEIRARKRMSMEFLYLFLGCRTWSPRVFEIRARKKVSLG